MRSGHSMRVALAMLAVLLALCSLGPIAWAQTAPAPGPPVPPGPDPPTSPGIGESNAELFVILVSLTVLGLAAMAKVFDLKRKREDEAVRLQAEISDALLRERRLATLPVAPTVHFPIWARSSATIEMCGQVPTPELRRAVLHVAEQEASRIVTDFHVHDRIAIIPSVGARAA
jgi:hypothetical protein